MTDKLESEMTAGLSVVPCTHPREKVVYTGDGTPVNWCPDCHSNRLVGGSHGPTARDTAQATIVAQAAEIERIAAHNQTLQRDLDAACDGESKWQAACMRLSDKLESLKTKQVADIDEVMRLADDYAGENYKAERFGGHYCEDRYAAREALRSHLAKDRT